MLLGKRVLSVDPGAHTVTTDGGETIGYGKLVGATGGSPRMLQISGGDLSGVQGVRTKADADADAMKAASETAGQIVVIGGGYIGLEATAVLNKAGKKVVFLEALDPSSRALPAPSCHAFTRRSIATLASTCGSAFASTRSRAIRM